MISAAIVFVAEVVDFVVDLPVVMVICCFCVVVVKITDFDVG